ncbi:anaerobic magnesium-protoporphyrin IX monomethyl ester cyclase [Candidatus Magnetomoraceae bacterium gMMP-15]
MIKTPHILLINPWIYDFAAYDFWAKPLGLLILAGILRQNSCKVSYIDCLDRFHKKSKASNPSKRYGRGPYIKTNVQKPKGLEDVKRNFSRYGIPIEWFINDLKSIKKPDLIFITSLMTYWYPGVFKTIQEVRNIFPDIPIVLGGIYATLCRDHAEKYAEVDEIVSGPGEALILKLIEKYTGWSDSSDFKEHDIDSYPYPAFDLQNKIPYIPILSLRGCPFSCDYCASKFLEPKIRKRSPKLVVKEILHWHSEGIRDFAFYDDALLFKPEKHAIPLLEGIIKSGCSDLRFHTPNAIHIREITSNIAKLLFKAGFETLRLGLETTAYEKRLDIKVTKQEFVQAVNYLQEAGFNYKQIGAYLLIGLPEQDIKTVEESIITVKKNKIQPILAHYTPIPHTALWDKAVASSGYDLKSDPIFTNNSISPCQKNGFSWKELTYLKNLCKM